MNVDVTVMSLEFGRFFVTAADLFAVIFATVVLVTKSAKFF